jgi:trehalose 6-phosphate phosphatase
MPATDCSAAFHDGIEWNFSAVTAFSWTFSLSSRLSKTADGDFILRPEIAPMQDFTEFPLPTTMELSSVALLLDVDGTVLDTAETPTSVFVPDSLRTSLRNLHGKSGGALALVSGRLIADLDGLFAPLRLPAIGGHGAEMRLSGQDQIQGRYADGIAVECRQQVAAVASDDPRIFVENKGSSLAVHYRFAPDLKETLKRTLAQIVARADDLELIDGKSVVEIKSRRFNKGTAVLELMRSPPFARRRPIFIGDDTTDESVFAALPALGGLGYSVDRAMAGANGMFGSPRRVRDWLGQLSAHA